MEVQERLDREMKIRDGAIKLINMCTHENQLLEATKTLLVSNRKILAHMSQLQNLKTAENINKANFISKKSME